MHFFKEKIMSSKNAVFIIYCQSQGKLKLSCSTFQKGEYICSCLRSIVQNQVRFGFVEQVSVTNESDYFTINQCQARSVVLKSYAAFAPVFEIELTHFPITASFIETNRVRLLG